MSGGHSKSPCKVGLRATFKELMSNKKNQQSELIKRIYMHFNVIFAILRFCLKDQKLTAACSGKSKCISLDKDLIFFTVPKVGLNRFKSL